MANSRRGKKINPAKNFSSAKDFALGKRVGRPKQKWETVENPKSGEPKGRWIKL